jgi:cell shape-determining protein MreD
VRTLYILGLGLVAIVVEMLVPPVRSVVSVRMVIVPAVAVFGGLQLRALWPFVVSTGLGFLLDLLTPNSLGVTVISLGAVAALAATQRTLALADRWSYQALLVLAGTFLFLLMDYAFYSLQLGHWNWHLDFWMKAALESLAAAALAPVLFWIFGRMPAFLGWKVEREEFSYAGR